MKEYEIFINGVKASFKDFAMMSLAIKLGKKFVAKMQGKRIDYFID